MGLSFQRRRGSSIRCWNRFSCVSWEMCGQYMIRMIPDSIIASSKRWKYHWLFSSSVRCTEGLDVRDPRAEPIRNPLDYPALAG